MIEIHLRVRMDFFVLCECQAPTQFTTSLMLKRIMRVPGTHSICVETDTYPQLVGYHRQ